MIPKGEINLLQQHSKKENNSKTIRHNTENGHYLSNKATLGK